MPVVLDARTLKVDQTCPQLFTFFKRNILSSDKGWDLLSARGTGKNTYYEINWGVKDEGTGIKGDKGESMVRGGGWDVSAKEMSGSRGKVRLKELKDSKIEDIFLNMLSSVFIVFV